MFMTRDNRLEGMICFWSVDAKSELFIDEDEEWNMKSPNQEDFCDGYIQSIFPATYKQLMPQEKLPRKGSCTWIDSLKILRG